MAHSLPVPPESLTPRLRAWVESVTESPVVASRVLTGGISSLMVGLDTADGNELVLRALDREPWRSDGASMVTREAAAMTLLADSDVATPQLIDCDPSGEAAGDPLLLMTRLPGRVRFDAEAAHAAALEQMAQALVRVHRISPAVGLRPPDFEPWGDRRDRDRIDWSADASLWDRAFALIDREHPPYRPVFMHRDFHPGNLLWTGDELTAVIDWTECSWGPADLDVAHCETNLALLHGPDTADRFRSCYLAAGGHLDDDPVARTYWRLLDALAFASDLTDDVVRQRFSAYVRGALGD